MTILGANELHYGRCAKGEFIPLTGGRTTMMSMPTNVCVAKQNIIYRFGQD